MSDSPETDAETWRPINYDSDVVYADLARKLERERDWARHDIEAYRDALGYPVRSDDYNGRLTDGSTPNNILHEASIQRAERAEAALAEAHQTIRECIEGMTSEYMGCPACGMGHLPDQDYNPHHPDCGLLPFLPGATVLTPQDAPSPSPTPAV